MKHLRWTILVLAVAVLSVFARASVVHAQRFAVFVGNNQVVNSSLYSYGKDITIDGTVNGDIFCAGQNVYIDAVVNGDILCAGQNVTVNGTVNGSVRLVGQTVSLDASVARSASVAAENFSLDSGSSVGRDLSFVANSIDVKGSVGRDIVGTGQTIAFNGVVGRDVQVSGGNINIKGNTSVAGNFDYSSNTRAQVSKAAKLKGKLQQTVPVSSQGSFINLRFYLLLLIGLLIFGLAIAYFFPRLLEQQGNYIRGHFTKALVVGLVASLLMPVVVIGLIFTTIGIPLAIFIVLAWLFGSFLGISTVGYYVGSLMLRGSREPLFITALGMVVVVTFWSLPIIGLIFLLFTYWLGVGTLLIGLNAQVKSED